MAGVPVPSGGPPDQGGVYQTPWALSESCFLVSYSYSSSKTASGFGIYLIDRYGNRELVHRDPLYSCVFPLPVQRRAAPPSIPDRVASAPLATCYISDIYRGMPQVERGSVKYLRISQRVGWPLDQQIGAMRYLPGDAWSRQFGHWAWAPVRVLGLVPVAADGSAHFQVPADTSLYFQALDASLLEVRRMRSHISFQPGEMRGCVGCHETGNKTPPPGPLSLTALRTPPAHPTPPPWGAQRLLGYEWMIQPVLDQHCVRCHGAQQPDGGLDLTGAVAADGFMQSFRTMFGVAPGEDSTRVTRPAPRRAWSSSQIG